jgi:hypothetical protein
MSHPRRNLSRIAAILRAAALPFAKLMDMTQSSSYSLPPHKLTIDAPTKKFVVMGLCFLSPLTDVKIGDVQTVELFCVGCLVAATAIFHRNGWSFRTDGNIASLIRHYALFLMLTVLLAFVSLRLPTFPLPDTGFLKTAPFLSLSRCVQMAAAMGSIALLGLAFTERTSLISLAAQCYVYAGLIEAAYGLISWLALFGHVTLGGASMIDFARAKGFFAEGGPFGVYLVSVILVSFFRYRILQNCSWLSFWLQMILLVVTFLASWSKAGILLIVVLAFYYSIITSRVKYVLVLTLLISPLVIYTDILQALVSYVVGFLDFDNLIAEHADDPSFAYGRIMASILVPIIIAHEPLLGIGFGNYSIERNNPTYIGGLPLADQWDLPGLGLFGYAAELGLPLLIYLCWIIWRPVRVAQKERAPKLVLLLASYQMFAQVIGVQITFVYPWIVSALAIGYAVTPRSQASDAIFSESK